MERDKGSFSKNTKAHLILGIILVLLGIAILAELVDAVPWRMRDIVFSWQMVLIVLGVIFISGKDSKSTGFILLAIGGFFIMPKFFDVPDFWRSLFWPSILILLGLLVIFGRGKRHYIHRSKSSGDDILDDVAIFGGSDQVLSSQNFQGGKITNIFGGAKYDMRKAVLAEGKNYLEVTMIFGGSKFIVPEDWDIKLEVTSIFGGFSDKRLRSIVVPDSSRQLIITGVAIFGGGELNNI
jgi:predicted membrane protein